MQLPKLASESSVTKPPTADARVGLVPVTATGDGFMMLTNTNGAFSLALSNFSDAATYRITAEPATEFAAAASLSATACQTEPTSGSCISAPTATGVNIAMAAGQSATIAIFVNSAEPVYRDVLKNRLIVRALDSSGQVHAATSVAVASNLPE